MMMILHALRFLTTSLRSSKAHPRSIISSIHLFLGLIIHRQCTGGAEISTQISTLAGI